MTNNQRVPSDSQTDVEPIDKPRRRTTLLLSIAAVALVLDLISKVVAVATLSGRPPISIAGGALYLTLARNSGAAFSMGTEMTVVISCIVIAVSIGILVVSRKVAYGPWAWALGLILGGALGNLVDRIFRHPAPLRGAVIDYLSLFDPYGQVWPIFNIADICVVCGGIFAGLLAIRGFELDGTKMLNEKAERPASGSADETTAS